MLLNNNKIKNLPINKKVSDGSGLYLTLSSKKKGKWTYRYNFEGKAKEMINTIALTIDNCNNHYESFKLIFEELHKHGGWLHKDDMLPDDFTIDEFKVELIACILAYNSGSPIPYSERTITNF